MNEGGIVLTLMAAMTVVILGAGYGCETYSCGTKAEKMGMRADWGPVQGCMVKTKSGWRPMSAIRDIDP